jgi:hypothetical protein
MGRQVPPLPTFPEMLATKKIHSVVAQVVVKCGRRRNLDANL